MIFLISYLQPMKDWILLLMVTVMVVVDILYLIVVTYDGWRLKLDVKLLIREVQLVIEGEKGIL